ncbi:hypothetical protein Gotri_007042 [Gossypium trilobum]|uniref:Heat shock factor binding protein n=3 Tax=Gossypium TaxID=3633 RepID=A0A7J9EFH3_9ROSI|nr:hypothetical protein [Gossypium aridum]MBA0771544.1 hypothetical protein [Gossypium trilobum]
MFFHKITTSSNISNVTSKWFVVFALDDMGNRINELEQSINDLKAEMGVEGTSSPLDPSKQKSDEAKEDEGSA